MLQLAEPLLPYALAFAAGAMVYVVVDDIVPEAHSWLVNSTSYRSLLDSLIIRLYTSIVASGFFKCQGDLISEVMTQYNIMLHIVFAFLMLCTNTGLYQDPCLPM